MAGKNNGKWKRRAVIGCLILFLLSGMGQVVFAAEIETETETAQVQPQPKAKPKSKYKISKQTLSMAPATTEKLKLKGAPQAKVKWSSSSKSVAAVSKTGVVTAKKKGTAKIKATYKGKKYTCVVNVKYKEHKTKDGMKYRDVSGDFGRSGRWFKKKIDGGKYYYTNTDGSSIYFKVTGSKYVDVDFVSRIAVAMPYFAYSVDGGKMKRQPVGQRRISVGNTKTHYVRLIIDSMSESENRWGGEAGVGIKRLKPVTKSGVITAIQPKNKTIAFYGDSITQGVRALNMELSPSGTSASHSYAWYCADYLNMTPYFAGYGGSGIVQSGSYTKCYNAIRSFSATREAKKFDADVIVVEHGTNDVFTDAPTFTTEYRNVLKKLHKEHPKAKIMALIPFTTLHTQEIRDAASPYKWCTVVETASWGISYTDGLHPNTSGAKTVGKNLAKKIKAARK